MFALLKVARRFLAAPVLGMALGMGSPVWAVEDQESVPGEYVVKFKDSPLVGQLLKRPTVFSERLGASVRGYIGSAHAALVKRASIETQESAIQVLSQDPLIEYVEPNYVYRMAKQPSQTMYGEHWGLRNAGGNKGEAQDFDSLPPGKGTPVDIQAEAVWDMTTGSKKVLVLVVDSGIDYRHPNLIENIWTNPGESGRDPTGRDKSSNGIDDDSNGYVDDLHGMSVTDKRLGGDPMDTLGHGTHCAGIIGAYSSDHRGIAGVNWSIQIASARYLGTISGDLAGAIRAVNYAIAIKAKIINASWGGNDFSRLLRETLLRANEAGVLMVAAAGNYSRDNDTYPFYPASYSLENIISVAAVNSDGELAQFSNYGKKTVHLGAPGVDIWSTVPGGSWDLKSGTSMAAPFVTGVAALVLSALPQPDLMTPGELKEVILSTVRPFDSLSEKVSTGGGLNAPDAVMVGIVRNVAKVFMVEPIK